MLQTGRNTVIAFGIYFIGILIMSFGTSLMIEVKHLGIAPWDVLIAGMAEQSGLTFGTWNMLLGLMLVSITAIFNRALIHIGTILNTLLIGPLIDFFHSLHLLPALSAGWEQYFILVLGILLNGFGSGMYVAARLGAGPKDGVLLTVAKKLNVSTPKARLALEGSVLVVGIVVGGPFFIGTLIFSPIIGPVFQYSQNKWAKINRYLTKKQPTF